MNIATLVGAPSSVTLSAPSVSASRYPERRPALRLSRGLSGGSRGRGEHRRGGERAECHTVGVGVAQEVREARLPEELDGGERHAERHARHDDDADGHGAHELVARGGEDLRHLPAHRYGPAQARGRAGRPRPPAPPPRSGTRSPPARRRAPRCRSPRTLRRLRAPARRASRGRPPIRLPTAIADALGGRAARQAVAQRRGRVEQTERIHVPGLERPRDQRAPGREQRRRCAEGRHALRRGEDQEAHGGEGGAARAAPAGGRRGRRARRSAPRARSRRRCARRTRRRSRRARGRAPAA